MKKLLHIIASPRELESRTLQIADPFLEVFQQKNPDCVIDELHLEKEELPSLSMKRVDGKYLLMDGKDLYGEFKEKWMEILSHIERFLSADLYLISTPMWNFSIPYMLKHYIDIIVQPKYLFRYTDKGTVEGLAKNKKMAILCSRGGTYLSQEMQGYDFQEPYLRAIFGFVGITDIHFVIAQPMDMGKEIQQQKLQEAINAAKQLAGLFHA
jgi:FMN-dependent NADH-azoreductase